MQHLILYFTHTIRDISPWCTFIENLQPQLASSGVGRFDSDDMAIDGGDCEAVFQGPDAKALFAFILAHIQGLAFLQKPTTRVELVFGALDGTAKQHTFNLWDELPAS
ncbi:hypothetical protein [Pseudomonas sp. P7548]|uniref:hypothetical protein n=1 Tax=Pseudomonas sp. P7548 TaxID=2726981 RepID=UPI0015B80E56|nr:hypothetical protein [Pseudomonas sp. P7548]NWE19815.1 hypothetical protein [Pseudomonas sp. P7548]